MSFLQSCFLPQAVRDRQPTWKARERMLAMREGGQLRAEEPTESTTGSEVRALKKWQKLDIPESGEKLPDAWSRLKGL